MRTKLWVIGTFILIFAWSCGQNKSKVNSSEISDKGSETGRFFADNSFWNQPIPDDAETDPHSEYWMELLANDPSCENFGINLKDYTIPIYEVDSTTPTEIIEEVSDKYITRDPLFMVSRYRFLPTWNPRRAVICTWL